METALPVKFEETIAEVVGFQVPPVRLFCEGTEQRVVELPRDALKELYSEQGQRR